MVSSGVVALRCTIEDMERRPITAAEMLAARINRTRTCWYWEGTFSSDGYPTFASSTEIVYVIPLLWRQENGPVPDGEVLTCIHPRAGFDVCVNPAHYEPRPRKRDLSATCPWGHDMADETNVWYTENGERHCLVCMTRRKVGSPREARRRKT